ncbi:MAG: Maf family protein [bacterium]
MYISKLSLVLASGSPRRKEILSGLGITYKVVPSGLDENSEGLEEGPELYSQKWAERKALAVYERLSEPEAWYLAVDTVVVLDERIMGKPSGRSEAFEYLSCLSGRWHRVVSGYCIYHPCSSEKLLRSVSSDVKFKELDRSEIEAYTNTEEPFDKAGGYAVQGVGAFMVEAIRGSYTNVVGIPLCEVVDDLRRLDVIEVDSGKGLK